MASLGLLAPDEEDEEDNDIWYFSRKEIEVNSPSRKDGISLKKETYFLRSYSTFIQDLGMRIRVRQETIATAIVFCHRFFVRRSHAKHDRFKIATSCLFLASKVEESWRPLKTVVAVSYAKINKMGSEAVNALFKKDWRIYQEEENLILQGEKLVLETIDFDLAVKHPYKTLVEATKKFKDVADRKALSQVAWNFVNDGLRTSLCLQMKPRHVAAGALFLAAKFLKIKLYFDGQKAWWREFAVTPSQLEDYSNQILELYDHYSTPRASQSHQAKASAAEATAPSKVLVNGKTACNNTGAADPPLIAYDGNQNLQDTDSEKHKTACHEIINYDQQPVKKLIITAQHINNRFSAKSSAGTITG